MRFKTDLLPKSKMTIPHQPQAEARGLYEAAPSPRACACDWSKRICVRGEIKVRFALLLSLCTFNVAPTRAQFLVKTPQMQEIWQPETQYGLQVMALSPDAETVALKLVESQNIVLQKFGSDQKKVLKLADLNYDRLQAASFSPDGSQLAVLTRSWTKDAKVRVRFWDVRNGKFLEEWSENAEDNKHYRMFWTARGLTMGVVQPNGQSTLWLWQLQENDAGRWITASKDEIKTYSSELSTLDISTDGKYAVVLTNSNVAVVDVATQSVLRQHRVLDASDPASQQFKPRLRFSRDGQSVLIGGSDYRNINARVWNWPNDSIIELQNSQNAVSLAWSPDGKLVFGDGVRLWDATTGKLLGGVNVSRAFITSYDNPVFFAPDGKSAISVSNGLIRWDVEKLRALQGRVLDLPRPGAPETTDVQLNPQAFGNNYGFGIVRQGVVTSENPRQTVLTWRVRDEATKRIGGDLPPAIYYGDENRANVAISSDGHIVAVANGNYRTGNTEVLMYDVAQKRALKPLRVVKDSVQILQFSPNGKLLAMSSEGKRVRVFDMKNGELMQLWRVQPRAVHTIEETNGRTYGTYENALAWSPDSRSLALPHDDSSGANVRIVDVESGATTRFLRSVNRSAIESLTWSRDGKTLAAGGTPVRVWDLRSGRIGRALQIFQEGTDISDGSTGFVGFARDGDLLAGDGYRAKRWNLDWLQAPLRDQSRLSWNVSAAPAKIAQGETINWDNSYIEYSPDGKLLATQGRDGVSVWRIADLKLLRQTKALQSPRFSPDSRSLFDATNQKIVRFEIATGKISQRALPKNTEMVLRASEEKDSPFAQPIRLSLTDAKIVAAGRHRVLVDWKTDPDWVYSSAISPDGKTVAASRDSSVWLWDLATQKRRVLEVAGDANYIELQISPDGKTVAGANINGFVTLWNAQTGEVIHTLSGHIASAYALAFSPDSRRLASGGADNTVRVWSISTGKLERVFDGHQGAVLDLSWSPDGRDIASRSQDGTVKIWSAP